LLRPAGLLPSVSRAFDTPLGSVGSLLPAGVCYQALRRLPGQDLHLLDQRVFQDAPLNHPTRTVRPDCNRSVERRLREELAKLRVEINEDKSRMVDLAKGESFTFLGFEYRRILSRAGLWRPNYAPKLKKRTALFAKLREVFRRNVSQPVGKVIQEINPILRGWVNYFRVGHSTRCFSMVRHWVEVKVRRHLMRARGRQGRGWKRWSRDWMYGTLGLFNNYRVGPPLLKAQPASHVL
jgi:hypothetical protein